MVFGITSRELSHHYGCFVEKVNMPSTWLRHNLPIWLLKGLEPIMSGGDCYDEVHDIALGDSPEELLVWAGLQGLSIAEDPLRDQLRSTQLLYNILDDHVCTHQVSINLFELDAKALHHVFDVQPILI